MQAICGVDLPINADGKAVTGTGLYVGRCEPTQDSDIPGKDLNPETYAITVRDGSIFFNGRYPTQAPEASARERYEKRLVRVGETV